MVAIFLACLLSCVMCMEFLVTKEYTDYLKKHVSWEVVDYEDNIFRGWTVEEANLFLGSTIQNDESSLPYFTTDKAIPSQIFWDGDSCTSPVRNQGNCGAGWAFAVAGMLSDRCCRTGIYRGWLSPQELVSCDRKNSGCGGGWASIALNYVQENNGLVEEECFPYVARMKDCPEKCANGKEWDKTHKCNCVNPKQCIGKDQIKGCIGSGPIVVTFDVYSSFFTYRSGIYKCDGKGTHVGTHSVSAIGFADTPECYILARNSWGMNWGEFGLFKIACETCGVEGKYRNGNVMCENIH